MNSDKSIQFNTSSAGETEALGEKIGTALEAGSVVALYGGLGAGKTTITKGIARGLGVQDIVHSPTFNLIHEHIGRLPVYHFDVYRLRDSSDMYDLGYEEYFFGDGVAIIEWPEVVADILPDDRLEIHIDADGDSRTLSLRSTGENSARLLGLIISRLV